MENPAILEQEIADIERRLAEKKTALEQSQTTAPAEKDILHEVVREKIGETMPSGFPSSSPTAPATPPVLPPPTTEPPSYLSDDLKNQVQELVNIAFTQGLAEAVKKVASLDNPALLDAFHDVLADQLYDLLVERGQLEKI